MTTALETEKPAPTAKEDRRLARREPWFADWFQDRPSRRFFHEFERMLDDFAGNWRTPGESAWMTLAWAPSIDAFEREGAFVVRADLPGLTKENIRIEAADGVLTLEGERTLEKKQEREGYYRAERREGRFLRRIPLPEGALPAKAAAAFLNGVLEVTVPLEKKAAPPAPMRVEVK